MIEAGDGGFPLSFSSEEQPGYRSDNGTLIESQGPGFFDDHGNFYPHVDGMYDDRAQFHASTPGYTDEYAQFHKFSDTYLTSYLYQEMNGHLSKNQYGPVPKIEPINNKYLPNHPNIFHHHINDLQLAPNWEYEAKKLEEITWKKYGLGRPQDIVVQEPYKLFFRQVRLFTTDITQLDRSTSVKKTWIWSPDKSRFLEHKTAIKIFNDDPDFAYGYYLPTPQVRNKRDAWRTYYAIAHILDLCSSTIKPTQISNFLEHLLKNFSIS